MTDIPSTVAMTQALGRQAVSLSVMKQSTEMEQEFANILENAADSAPISNTHGTNIDFTV